MRSFEGFFAIEKSPSDCYSNGDLGRGLTLITQEYDIKDSAFCQGLSDELEQRFVPKKELSLFLAASYERLGMDYRYLRVSDCGSFLEFKRRSDSEKFSLFRANFCKDRLCPMCSWRRSYKIFAQVSKIMNFIGSDYRFLFLTLTVPNCPPELLSSTIDKMQAAWQRLIHRSRFKRSICGFYKVLEITRNKKSGYYHPHFHVVLAVSDEYFNLFGSLYIPRNEWLSLWQAAMRDDSITQVDVRAVKDKHSACAASASMAAAVPVQELAQSYASAVAEIAKYAVKSSDFIFKSNPRLTDKIVFELSCALASRRLTAFGGCFKSAWQQLGLDDAEDGDLVHADSELRSDVSEMIYRYGWSSGCYKLIGIQDAKEVIV